MYKFKYKNNLYKFKDGNFYIMAGEHNLYISKIVDEKIINILTEVIKRN